MKLISLTSATLLVTLLFSLNLPVLRAQDDQGSAASIANGGSATAAALTPEERAQKRKVESQVLANDASLKAMHDDLVKQRQDLEDQGEKATPEAKKAVMEKWYAYRAKLRAAAVILDTTMTPIYAKIDAYRLAHPRAHN